MQGWGCSCTPELPCLPFDTAVPELASYMAATATALRSLKGVAVAHSPMAPNGVRVITCCPKDPKRTCSDTPTPSIAWLDALVATDAQLYHGVDWLASHSYPCEAPACGLAKDRPDGGWNAPFERAVPGLTLYRNESSAVGRQLPVIITETGWCHLSNANSTEVGEDLRGSYTVSAFKLWRADPQVLAVTPFLLAGEQWEFPQGQGFPWMHENGSAIGGARGTYAQVAALARGGDL